MTTYVAFDGDKDIWAYGYMKGWSENKRIDFELLDAHDLDNMTARARGEYYVKGKLRERMNKSKAFVLLVGESTKHLHKYVGWEIDLAVELGLPIIVVNLNNKSGLDRDNCPAKIRSGLLKKNRSARGSPSPSACAVHIPFKLAAIRHALDRWPAEFRGLSQAKHTATRRRARPRWRHSREKLAAGVVLRSGGRSGLHRVNHASTSASPPKDCDLSPSGYCRAPAAFFINQVATRLGSASPWDRHCRKP